MLLRGAMTNTIILHIGEGTTIDGGPYSNAEILEVTSDGTLLVANGEFDETHGTNVDDIESHLRGELNDNQPIHVTGVPKEDSAGSIELPLVDHFDVTLFGSVPVEILTAESIRKGNVRGYDYHDIQEWIDEHGASYSPA